jgi:uncharacterized repeat protein (TIGR01451 family)
LEVILLTANSGVVAYDLPGTANASIQWGTGRGNYQRDGNLSTAIQPTLVDSTKISSLLNANPGESLTFTISMHNPSGTINNASMTDALPPGLEFAGNLWYSSGIASYSNGIVNWTGEVGQLADVIVRFDVTVDVGISSSTTIINTATIAEAAGRSWQRQARVYVLTHPSFLPIVRH